MTNEIDSKEVAVVKQQASNAVNAATDLTIKTNEDMVKATDILSKIKTVAKMAKQRKELITKPLNESLKSIRSLFLPIEQNCEEAESIIKRKMLTFQDEQEKAREAAKEKIVDRVERGTLKPETAVKKLDNLEQVQTNVQGKVGAIATRLVKKYRVTDESKLPREFLVPNMSKITEALKAGHDVPGAEAYTEKVIASSSELRAHDPLLGQG